jgi:hypothetical protein
LSQRAIASLAFVAAAGVDNTMAATAKSGVMAQKIILPRMALRIGSSLD